MINLHLVYHFPGVDNEGAQLNLSDDNIDDPESGLHI